jgi:hypothetical protein
MRYTRFATPVALLLVLAACSDQPAIDPTAPPVGSDAPQRLELDAAPMAWRGGRHRGDLVEAVETWNDNISRFSILAATNPPTESRIQAMANTTMHDVLNAVQRRFEPYAYDGHATRPVSVAPAVATGVYDVLAALGAELPAPAALQFITQAYTDYMAALDQCDEVTRGVQLGHDAATAMLALRAGDGSAGPSAVVFTSTGEPGTFRSTVGTATALTGPRSIPQWGNIRPFVLTSGSQFRAPPMYGAATVEDAVQTPRYLADYAEVRRLGGQASERTAEQTDIAYFWLGGDPQTWNDAARSLAANRHLNAWQLARLVAHVSLARADALISGFESAYTYNFWRPVTAIRLGNLDPATPGDPTWQVSTFSIASNGPTPPFPDHSAAPIVAASAAAQVILADLDGPTAFTWESPTLPGKPRSFRSVEAAVRESAEARVYGGSFFRQATEAGMAQGDLVGRYVAAHSLRRTFGHDDD